LKSPDILGEITCRSSNLNFRKKLKIAHCCPQLDCDLVVVIEILVKRQYLSLLKQAQKLSVHFAKVRLQLRLTIKRPLPRVRHERD